jgi:UDP-N-acetyl-D-glucosamine/UDP-N-acetyl-D-galactosamine dehydrogenase
MKNNKICVVGLGYVGLPLAVAFAEKFNVIGFDINSSRLKELEGGYDRTFEVEDDLLTSVKNNITYTSDIQDTKDCNIYIVTVPTPIDKANRPDLTPLVESSKTIGTVLNKDDIVIYESTVYPGVTEDICVPELEKSSGMKFNKDFYCGYSPERINPGDKEYTVTKILKVTAGSTPKIAQQVDDLYKQVITAGTHMASSIKVAEAAKVIENTQRDVNIALINELALIFDQMDIDTNEVLEAAATKWNFIKLTPGLVGGHCIGVDPYYLTFKAEELGYQPDLILASRQINNSMAQYVSDKTIKEMIKAGISIKGANVLILGATFKEDCPDLRNTKVFDIADGLKDFAVNVDIYDPLIKSIRESEKNRNIIYIDPIGGVKKYDAVIVAVAHKNFRSYTMNDYRSLLTDKLVIIDIKGIVKNPTWRL